MRKNGTEYGKQGSISAAAYVESVKVKEADPNLVALVTVRYPALKGLSLAYQNPKAANGQGDVFYLREKSNTYTQIPAGDILKREGNVLVYKSGKNFAAMDIRSGFEFYTSGIPYKEQWFPQHYAMLAKTLSNLQGLLDMKLQEYGLTPRYAQAQMPTFSGKATQNTGKVEKSGAFPVKLNSPAGATTEKDKILAKIRDEHAKFLNKIKKITEQMLTYSVRSPETKKLHNEQMKLSNEFRDQILPALADQYRKVANTKDKNGFILSLALRDNPMAESQPVKPTPETKAQQPYKIGDLIRTDKAISRQSLYEKTFGVKPAKNLLNPEGIEYAKLKGITLSYQNPKAANGQGDRYYVRIKRGVYSELAPERIIKREGNLLAFTGNKQWGIMDIRSGFTAYRSLGTYKPTQGIVGKLSDYIENPNALEIDIQEYGLTPRYAQAQMPTFSGTNTQSTGKVEKSGAFKF